MDGIESESFWIVCPDFADVFVGCETFEGLETPAVVVGVDEVGKVALKLPVAVIVIALDGGFLDSPVHAFDLAVSPRMLDLGKPVLDAILAAAHVEHMGHVPGRGTIGVTRRKGELNAVVGEHGVDFVRNRLNQRHQEGGCRCSAGLLHKLDKGKLARPVNCDVQVELALDGADLGDIDMDT